MKVWLSDSEAIVVETALKARQVFSTLRGACYRSALFLRLYLKERHGIEGKAIVGYVNAGDGLAYASHAWFQYEGQVTDIAISRPLNPEHNAPGPLMVHGMELEPGHPYSYHESMPQEATALLDMIAQDPRFAPALAFQRRTHDEVSACMHDDDLARKYLDQAEDGWNYDAIREAIASDKKITESR